MKRVREGDGFSDGGFSVEAVTLATVEAVERLVGVLDDLDADSGEEEFGDLEPAAVTVHALVVQLETIRVSEDYPRRIALDKSLEQQGRTLSAALSRALDAVTHDELLEALIALNASNGIARLQDMFGREI